MEIETGNWWVSIKSIDLPAREALVDLLTIEGKREVKLGFISDDCFEELLERFRKGEKRFWLRLLRGFVVQVLPIKDDPELVSLSLERERKRQEETPVLLTVNMEVGTMVYPPRSERVNIDHALDRAVDSILLSKRKRK